MIILPDKHLPVHDSRTDSLSQQYWEDTGPPEHRLSLCSRFWEKKRACQHAENDQNLTNQQDVAE